MPGPINQLLLGSIVSIHDAACVKVESRTMAGSRPNPKAAWAVNFIPGGFNQSVGCVRSRLCQGVLTLKGAHVVFAHRCRFA